jgi:hypothetical protein
MRVRTWTLLATIGLLAAGCAEATEQGAGGGPEAAEQPEQPTHESELTINAFDFGFDLSGVTSLPPGQVTFTMTNEASSPITPSSFCWPTG